MPRPIQFQVPASIGDPASIWGSASIWGFTVNTFQRFYPHSYTIHMDIAYGICYGTVSVCSSAHAGTCGVETTENQAINANGW